MGNHRILPLPDEPATAALGRRVAAVLRAGDAVALFGALGMGKTVLARGLIQALAGPVEVPSPTFTLVQVYEALPAPVWHFDLYRLEDPEEVWELGYEEALVEGIGLIEWPERLGTLLPATRLEIRLAPGAAEESRRATLIGFGGDWAARLPLILPAASP